MQEEKQIRIALVEDHVLVRCGFAQMINNFDQCSVIFEAGSASEMIGFIKAGLVPDLILLDLKMEDDDNGFMAAEWLHSNYPNILILVVSMVQTEVTMIRLLKEGARGFLRKDITPPELRAAIYMTMQSGYYYNNSASGKIINLFRRMDGQTTLMRLTLSDIELRFLKHTCSDLTYKEIAMKMNVNPRAIDNLRDHLFEKLDVKSRVGLAMFAVRHCIFTV